MVSSAISSIPWSEIRSGLWTRGFGRMGKLLTRAQCEELRSLYSNASLFRSRIDMERYRFGRGEYQYFANPLPALVAELREELYRFLAPTANEWMSALRIPADFPANLDSFLKQCHRRGQKRPTPLLLRYEKGDYNCLHQDVYGDRVSVSGDLCTQQAGRRIHGRRLAFSRTAAASAIRWSRHSNGTGRSRR